MVAPHQPSSLFERSDRYQQVRVLARGSFATVALAQDLLGGGRGGLVALKLLPRSQVAPGGFAEAEVLNHLALRHPHIVSLDEVFLTDTHLVMVLEYAPYGDLVGHVPCGEGLPEREARWIFQQVMFSLDYCHRMGVASRDIKLENVLICSEGPMPIVKLADFGLSTSQPEAATGNVGTPAYFAPEVLAAAKGRPYDAKRADVWSAGVLLYAMLAGAFPFQRPEDAVLERKQRVEAMLQRIQRVDWSCPNWLSQECRDLLMWMLEEDPALRPSAQDILRHPWCAKGMDADTMLCCNDGFLSKSRTNPPPPKMLADIRRLLCEAQLCMAVDTPTAAQSKAYQAHAAGGSSDCSEGTNALVSSTDLLAFSTT